MLKNRFRKYLPVVVDIETGGFNPETNAILEIAITLIEEKNNKLFVGETFRHHITPFEGSVVEKESLECRGLTEEDLSVDVKIIDSSEMKKLMSDSEVVFNF